MDIPATVMRSRYLPPEEDERRWGLYVVDCGFFLVPPGADYPPPQDGQLPGEYSLSWEKGRMLHEYQLVYITEGRGVFESAQMGRVRIEAGHVFLLFPGVWHRFRPIREIGWSENWIGFSGEMADRIMGGFFSPDNAVIQVGHDQELQNLIQSVTGILDQAPPGYQQIIGARTIEALALIRSRAMSLHPVDRAAALKVEQARRYLAKHYYKSVDMTRLAAKLGLSYSRLRVLFKTQTGVAPYQYKLDICMNFARHWLTDSNLSVAEIAERLGFSSAQYFSRLFSEKVGCSPSAYRKR